jgi:hypothetical protein
MRKSEIKRVVLTWREINLLNNFNEFTEIIDNKYFFTSANENRS